MKNNELQTTNYTGQIETALALIRQGHGNRVTRSPAPESFDLHCVCAVHDKPYTLRFVRQPSGRLRFSASVKGKAAASPDNAQTVDVGRTMRLGLLETDKSRCAWCGDKSFHHCSSHCGALVCGGRMKGNTFHCRPSCGAEWVGVPLQEVKGTVQEQPRRPSCPVAAANVARAGKEPLRLSAGAVMELRKGEQQQ
jgi:hypothetical protein